MSKSTTTLPALSVARETGFGHPSLELERCCRWSDEELAKLDIAAVNLMCAGGLPGAENVKFDRLHDWLDEAARQADFQTRRHWYRFDLSPESYHTSPGFFCCSFLLQTLQEDFKVRYNPARARDHKFQDLKCLDPDFRDSRDLFIHGIVDGDGGTCASMPVLYVAVGRRLGYPLKLVESRGHLFMRWDDPAGKCLGYPEVLNIEGAGEGIALYPDSHYRQWPEPWTADDETGGWFLKSLTPREELAAFLVTRAACLEDNRRLPEAVQAYIWARDLAPHDGRYVQLAANRANRLAFQRQQEVVLLMEINRQNRERRQQALSPPGMAGAGNESKPPHGSWCRCRDCEVAREAAEEVRPGICHATGCQCFHCREAMQSGSSTPRTLSHSPACQCVSCRFVHEATGSWHPQQYFVQAVKFK
ncbi:MAG TPA: hypothetical protein VND64_04280 [Pirellulales bacterium]|nr:hypothetical protein [Pirellulales bacterium]